jgi:hypothetical protein
LNGIIAYASCTWGSVLERSGAINLPGPIEKFPPMACG